MSTNDVPGAVATHNDVLAMGCWAEHDDGSLILVEAVEGGNVIFSLFDVTADPKVEWRTRMGEDAFKTRFSWRPGDDDDDNIRWTWHDKTLFPWDRIMGEFPEGQKHPSAEEQLSAAARVARNLSLRAGIVTERHEIRPTSQDTGRSMMERINDALAALRK